MEALERPCLSNTWGLNACCGFCDAFTAEKAVASSKTLLASLVGQEEMVLFTLEWHTLCQRV